MYTKPELLPQCFYTYPNFSETQVTPNKPLSIKLNISSYVSSAFWLFHYFQEISQDGNLATQVPSCYELGCDYRLKIQAILLTADPGNISSNLKVKYLTGDQSDFSGSM